jgi:Holliday junction resolvase RusA-like endonuclease
MSGRILAMFRVDGRARTKGSLKVYCTKGRDHRVRLEEETKDSSRWRRLVALECQRHQKAMWGKLLGHAGPVEVRLGVYFARQLSTAQCAAPGEVVPSHRTPFPTDVMLGDGDKLARNVGDALQDSRIILDDSQITDWMIAKRWAPDGEKAHVEILIMEATDVAAPFWMPKEVGVQP